MWELFKRKVKVEQPPQPPELTYEEKREQRLKSEIGKYIILWKVKTLQTVVCSEAQYDYTGMGQKYRSHFEDIPHTTVTSAEIIEGTLSNVSQKMICVDNKWYAFGYEAEKIYEYKFIPL